MSDSPSPWQDEIVQRVRVLQIIVAAQLAGVVIFLAVFILIVQQGEAPGANGNLPLVTYVATAFAVGTLFARLIIPAVIVVRGRRSIIHGTWQLPARQDERGQEDLTGFLGRTGDAGKLWFVFFCRTMVAAAIVEGAVFFCLVAYLVEHSPLSLIIGIVLTFGLATHVPTRRGVVHWIEDQLDLIKQQRQFGG